MFLENQWLVSDVFPIEKKSPFLGDMRHYFRGCTIGGVAKSFSKQHDIEIWKWYTGPFFGNP